MALAFLRRHRWWFNWFLVLIIASFIYFYIPAFRGGDVGAPGEALAQVGGLPITVGEFQRAYVAQRQRLEQMSQRRLDEATLRSFGLEQRVIEGLVADRLITLEARHLGLAVDDESVAREIAKMPGLQDNGRFVGALEYRRRLQLQGQSTQEFEDAVRASLLRERLEALVGDGAGVTPAEAEREFRRRNEQLKAEYVLVDQARFRSQAQAGDDEVKARFEAKREVYRIPERRVVSYLLVDDQALESRVSVTDRDVEAYYQEHRDDFRQEEQVCASHILVKVKADAAGEGHADDEAKKLAASLLEEVKKGGDFAAIAKKSSEDKGSAANGGELPCFPRGRMVPEFDNAAFAMNAGETSELVKSSFGYHIIRVSSRREEGVLPLTQVKERIKRLVLSRRVQALVEEKSQAIGDALKKGGDLAAAGKAQGLSVQKSAPLSRGESTPPLDSPALVARAYELGPGQLEKEGFVVGRGVAFIALAEIQASRLPELKEVQERVKAAVIDEKVLARAAAQAQELTARAQKLGLDKAAAALGLVRKETPSLVGRGQPLGDLGASQSLEDAAYALPEHTLSEPVRVPSGYAVLRVLEKKPFDPVEFEKQRASLMASLKEEKRGQLFQAYLGQLRQRTSVQRNPDALRRVVGRQ